MNTILTCIDFSDVSERLLAETGRLAHALDAQVELFHVIPGMSEFGMMGPGGVATTFQTGESETQLEKLNRMKDQLSQMDVRATSKVASGNIVELILLEAKQLLPERIILGSHGHGRLYKLLVGSIAEAVLRRSKVPVLVVPSLI